MAKSKDSNISQSWTIRVPNELAASIRSIFPPGTGNTEIVIESLKHLLGIDSDVSNAASDGRITQLEARLEEVLHRVAVLEGNTQPTSTTTNEDIWAILDKWSSSIGEKNESPRWANVAKLIQELQSALTSR